MTRFWFLCWIAVHLTGILFKLGFKLHVFYWQHVRLGEKVEFIGKAFKHLHKSTSQFLFIWDNCNTWKLRYPLVRFHLGEHFWHNWIVDPADIKVGRRTLGKVPWLSQEILFSARVRGNQLNVICAYSKTMTLRYLFYDWVHRVH